jgi:hypothetical protein
VAAVVAVLGGSGCGYRVHGAISPVPGGLGSIGIPTFVNTTPQFRLEQTISRAVLREFAARTRVPVSARDSGVDGILRGEIRSISSTPVTFGSDTFGSTFLVTVNLSVELVRARDGVVLWQNRDFLFRERYVLNRKVVDFFSEEGPALERLAREFAASLASTVLGR